MIESPAVWHTIFNVIGFSSLLAAILSYFLTARFQRRNWISDNRKLEWRQLIDELYECMQMMGLAFRWRGMLEDPEIDQAHVKIARGVVRGSQLIGNRLFIDDTLREHKIAEKWNALANMTKRPGDDLAAAGRAFIDAFGELHDEIVGLARKDLLAPPPRWKLS